MEAGSAVLFISEGLAWAFASLRTIVSLRQPGPLGLLGGLGLLEVEVCFDPGAARIASSGFFLQGLKGQHN